MCGGFDMGGNWSVRFGQHEGVKCYAIVSGQCWLSLEAFPTLSASGQVIASCCLAGVPSTSPAIWR